MLRVPAEAPGAMLPAGRDGDGTADRAGATEGGVGGNAHDAGGGGAAVDQQRAFFNIRGTRVGVVAGDDRFAGPRLVKC